MARSTDVRAAYARLPEERQRPARGDDGVARRTERSAGGRLYGGETREPPTSNTGKNGGRRSRAIRRPGRPSCS